jgi:hypothetical protein
MKCLFFIASEARKGGESPECLSLKKLQPNAGPDAVQGGPACPVSSNRRQRRTLKVADRRVRSLVDPECPVTLPVGSAYLSADRTRWRVRSRATKRVRSREELSGVRSNGVARLVTAMALSDVHYCYLSCSDRTRPVTLTGASGHHDFYCVVL